MNIRFDEKKLCDIMMDFYNTTGINITIIDDNGVIILREHKIRNDYCLYIQSKKPEICKKSDIQLLQKCRKSKKIESHICAAGLIDFAIPIMYNDTIVCFLIFGQMKPDNNFSAVEKYIRNFDLDPYIMRHHYSKLIKYNESKIQSISNIASILARYILLEDILKPHTNETLDKVIAYISDNLESPMTVQSICKFANISKSVLYKNFRTHFNCTVNEYIAAERVRKSIKLLLNTDLSIENIAHSVGFSGSAYYGKMFKKYNGTTPLKYRNKNKTY